MEKASFDEFSTNVVADNPISTDWQIEMCSLHKCVVGSHIEGGRVRGKNVERGQKRGNGGEAYQTKAAKHSFRICLCGPEKFYYIANKLIRKIDMGIEKTLK